VTGPRPRRGAPADEAPGDEERREHDALVEPFFGGLGLGATPDPGIEASDPPARPPSSAVGLWRRLLGLLGVGRR
jgi:hypothetical protein